MPSGATTADQTSAGEGEKRSLQWRGCQKPWKTTATERCNNSAAQEDATHASYFTWEHLIERIWQQGAEGLQGREETVEPIWAWGEAEARTVRNHTCGICKKGSVSGDQPWRRRRVSGAWSRGCVRLGADSGGGVGCGSCSCWFPWQKQWAELGGVGRSWKWTSCSCS